MCVCECLGCFAFFELSVRVLVVFGVSCWVLSGFPYDDVGSSSLSELSSSRAVLAIRVCFRRLVVRIFSSSSSLSLSLSLSVLFSSAVMWGARVVVFMLFSFLAKCCMNMCFCRLIFARVASAVLFSVVAIHFFLSASFL